MPAAFDRALEVSKSGKPVLIDAKITDKCGIPVEELELDIVDGDFVEKISTGYQETHGQMIPEEFFAAYDGQELRPITAYFKEYGVKP